MLLRISTLVISVLLSAGAHASPAPLTEDKVCDYIETRIATNRLQEKFKRNADQYDDVPRAFFKARNEMLAERGWRVDDFEQTQRRIINAGNGIKETRKLDDRADERKKEREEIRNNPHFTEEQKEQMLRMQRELYKAERGMADQSRPDWAAVEPWLDKLDKLTSWIAGNIDEPPAPCE